MNGRAAISFLHGEAVYADGASAAVPGLEGTKTLAVTIEARRLNGDDDTVTVSVEHSDDGLIWSAAASHEFTDDDAQTLSVSSPKAYARVSWELGGANPQPVLTANGRATAKEVADVSTNGGSQSVLKSTTTLTDAEIRGLPSLPFPGFELVPPAGDGKTLIFLHAVLQTVGFDTHPYGNIDPDGQLGLRGTGGIGATTDIFNVTSPLKNYLSSFLDQSGQVPAGDLTILLPSFIYDNDWGGPVPQVFSAHPSDPDPGFTLSISNGLGDFSGGDVGNSLTVTIIYHVLDLVS